ncbi:hypothetical protein [Chryseobacterium lathyri]|uniref:hypothetical protein n=1 Tax=Chryseobacterium lathyri TaxID=395933 RepID=UPI001CBE9592|nr:hypothetical protein [Chryseobacterium lathyri]
MRKNLVLRLFLLIALSISLYSCIHDETLASPDPVSQEYTNKSLWKEDEKYIRNVKKIFDQYANKSYFSGKYGNVLWDYALTMGTFDESFLEVPISRNGKINFVLTAERRGDRVFFKIKNEQSSNDFFDVLVFKDRSQLKGNIVSGSGDGISSKSECYNVTATWTWTNETTGEVIASYVYTKTRCTSTGPILTDPTTPGDCLEEDCTGGGTGGGGYPYPSNTANTNPCEKTKNDLNKPDVQQGINIIKAQALKTLSDVNAGEIGFKEKKDGTLAPADVTGAHKVVFNDVTDSYGGYHNHTAEGTHMFSPPDIQALLGFAAAQSLQDGVGNAYLGMIAAEWCNTCPDPKNILHYVIQYTGAASDLGTGGNHVYTEADMNEFIDDYQEIIDNLKSKSKNGTTYIKNSGDLNQKGLEKLFFNTLKVMKLDGKVNLQRVEANGTVNTVTLDSNGTPTGTPCPN